MNLKKFMLLSIIIFLSLGNGLLAAENKFAIFYYPEDRNNCKAASNKFIYEKSGNYKFRLHFHNSFPSEMLNSGNQDDILGYFWAVRNQPKNIFLNPSYINKLEVHIFSSFASDPRSGKLIKIPFAQVLRGRAFGGDLKQLTYDLNLRPPKVPSLSKPERAMAYVSPYKTWYVKASLYDKEEGRIIDTQVHSLRLLKKDTEILSEIAGTEDFSTLDAVPDSTLFDNFHSNERLDITYAYKTSNAWKKRWAFDGNLEAGNDSISSNSNGSSGNPFAVTPEYFNSTYGDFNKVTLGYDGFKISFYISSGYGETLEMNFSHTDSHEFSLLPGETGIIFSQIHVHNARYKKFAANKCGFLEEIGEQDLQRLFVHYNLVLVDRTQLANPNYLTNLGLEQLPNFYKQERFK